jgi:hypothetical protein
MGVHSRLSSSWGFTAGCHLHGGSQQVVIFMGVHSRFPSSCGFTAGCHLQGVHSKEAQESQDHLYIGIITLDRVKEVITMYYLMCFCPHNFIQDITNSVK